MLIEKEVITSDDVEAILGPRPWVSRTDEIIAANDALQAENEKEKTETEKPKKKRAPRKKKVEEVAPIVEDTIPTSNSEQSERSNSETV